MGSLVDGTSSWHHMHPSLILSNNASWNYIFYISWNYIFYISWNYIFYIFWKILCDLHLCESLAWFGERPIKNLWISAPLKVTEPEKWQTYLQYHHWQTISFWTRFTSFPAELFCEELLAYWKISVERYRPRSDMAGNKPLDGFYMVIQ